MHLHSSLLPVSLAASLLGLPTAARADDPAQAAPFRAAPPAWSETEPAPAPATRQAKPQPSPAEDENEEFTFDDEEPAPEPAAEQAAPTPPPVKPAAAKLVGPAPNAPSQAPVGNVDLHVPHVWMASGAIVLGVSAVAALVMAIELDEPQLAGGVFALGGLVGIAGLTVGVVMQNDRLAAAGQGAPRTLPSGVMLKLSFTP